MSWRTIEQKRADDALTRVKKLQRKGEAFKEKYRSYVDRIGPTIVMNGLGQALATELASDESAHKELYQSVQQWLCRPDGGVYPGSDDLLSSIMDNGEAMYLHAQAETLAWLEWHKKFCRAYFREGDGGS